MALVIEKLPLPLNVPLVKTVQLARGAARFVEIKTWYVPPEPALFVPVITMLPPDTVMPLMVGETAPAAIFNMPLLFRLLVSQLNPGAG